MINYKDMSNEQKRKYGFFKLNPKDVFRVRLGGVLFGKKKTRRQENRIQH
jgi:hypothetical protein